MFRHPALLRPGVKHLSFKESDITHALISKLYFTYCPTKFTKVHTFGLTNVKSYISIGGGWMLLLNRIGEHK